MTSLISQGTERRSNCPYGLSVRSVENTDMQLHVCGCGVRSDTIRLGRSFKKFTQEGIKLVLSLISNLLLLPTPPKTETHAMYFHLLSDQSCFGPLSLLLSDF